jgi:hypothetical protein
MSLGSLTREATRNDKSLSDISNESEILVSEDHDVGGRSRDGACEAANLLPSVVDNGAAYILQLHILFLLSCRASSPRDVCCNEFCPHAEYK